MYVSNDNRMFVDAKINGHPVRAKFDTGALPNAITNAMQNSIKLNNTGNSVPISSHSAQSQAMNSYLGNIIIGEKDLQDRLFVITNKIDNSDNMAIIGLLVTLSESYKYDLFLDISEKHIRVIDEKDCSDFISSTIQSFSAVPPARPKATGAGVVTFINGKSFSGFLDTGSNVTFVNVATAHVLGVSDAILMASDRDTMTSFNEERKCWLVKINNSVLISNSGKSFESNILRVCDTLEDILIGEDVLKYFDMFFVFSRNQLYMRPIVNK